MAKSFMVDLREMNRFERDLKTLFPSTHRRAIASTLNDKAFFARKIAREKEIPKQMETRGKFAINTVRVQKAKSNRNVNKIVSRFGQWEVKGWRGLAELEAGATTDWNPAGTRGARRGNEANRITRSARYDRLGTFENKDNYEGPNALAKNTSMLRQLDRQNFKGAIVVTDHPNLKDGVYKFSSKKFASTPRRGQARGRKKKKAVKLRKLVMIRSLEKDKTTNKKRPWMFTTVFKRIPRDYDERRYRTQISKFANRYRPR